VWTAVPEELLSFLPSYLPNTSTHGKIGDIPTTSLPSTGDTSCDRLQLKIAARVVYRALGPQAWHRGVLGNRMKLVGHGRDKGVWHRSGLFHRESAKILRICAEYTPVPNVIVPTIGTVFIQPKNPSPRYVLLLYWQPCKEPQSHPSIE